MQISGKFFSTKVARHIAILLFFAAAVPVTLLTFLSNQKISQLVSNYEHKSLIESSRSYALSAFSNLTFARSVLEQNIASNKSFDIESMRTRKTDYFMFNSVKVVSPDGIILNPIKHYCSSYQTKMTK
jgi:hypothetical protein